MDWTELVEKIYLAFSRVFDGLFKFLAKHLGGVETE